MGTCLSACLASILELRSSEVPRFCDGGLRFDLELSEWLASMGLRFTEHTPKEWLEINKGEPVRGYSILQGKTNLSNELNHAIVGFDSEPFHDPNPKSKFLNSSVFAIMILEKLDMAAFTEADERFPEAFIQQLRSAAKSRGQALVTDVSKEEGSHPLFADRCAITLGEATALIRWDGVRKGVQLEYGGCRIPFPIHDAELLQYAALAIPTCVSQICTKSR